MSQSRIKKIEAFVTCLLLIIAMCFSAPLSAKAEYDEKQIIVSKNYQTVDTFYGVPAKYVLGYSDTGDYCCAAYVSNFYKELFGVTVYNINIVDDKPSVYCWGKDVELREVSVPRAGDIMQTKNYTHVAIVKECKGDEVTLIEQNYKWTYNKQVNTVINRKVIRKNHYFYRLYINGVEQILPGSIPTANVKISQSKLNLKRGESKTISASMTENATDSIYWKSETPNVATVSNGKITAVSAGQANIVAYTNNGKQAVCTVTVTDDINKTAVSSVGTCYYTGAKLIPSVKLTYNGRTLVKGQDYDIKSSSSAIGTAVATITGKGFFTGSRTVSFNIKPAKPAGVRTTARSSTAIRLAWNAVPGADGYIVSVYDDSAKKWVRISKGKTTAVRHGSLLSGTDYKYKINAYKMVGKKAYYSPDAFITDSTNPSQTAFKAICKKSSTVTLTFNSQKGISGREVYMSSKGTGNTFKKICDTSKSSYTVTKAGKSTLKFFKVRAYKIVNGKRIYGAFSKVQMVLVF